MEYVPTLPLAIGVGLGMPKSSVGLTDVGVGLTAFGVRMGIRCGEEFR